MGGGCREGVDRLRTVVENLGKLIVDMKDSLERELSRLRREMRDGFAEISARFDEQAARHERMESSSREIE